MAVTWLGEKPIMEGLNYPKAVESKATTTNPKDLFGAKKVSLTTVSPFAMLYEARAMMDGVRKYGPYNWREKDVQARIYLDACLRHLYAWFEGEEYAPDSKAHHLGHARACLGILIDAIETGHMIDDRPITKDSKGLFGAILASVNEQVSNGA